MFIYKRIENNQLQLYVDDKLIYELNLDTGESEVFDNVTYEKYNSTNIKDLKCNNSNKQLIIINARVSLLSTESGGRKTAIISGYRPNHVFEYDNSGKLLNTFIGDIVFDGQKNIEPGESKDVKIRFLINQPIEKYLEKRGKWWLHEGPTLIGEVVML